jgi:hypothetical protein
MNPQHQPPGEESSEEEAKLAISRIGTLFRDVNRARSTTELLRSMAPDPAPTVLKRDVREAGAHEKIATEWFKI